MAEADQNPPKQQDAAADALDYLAVGQKDFTPPQEQTSLPSDPAEAAAAAAVDADPLAALTRMDQDPSEQAPADPSEAMAAGPALLAPDAPPKGGASVPPGQAAPPPPFRGVEAARAKLNRPATLAKAHQRITLQSYKTTMIPMLLVVGGLVAIAAMLSLIMLITGNAGEREFMGVDMRHWFLLMTLLDFPLSGAMIFGAYWFHRELKSVK